jgi:hypothetical protein
MGFRADVRAAAVSLMEGYKTANPGALRQVYPGRPASIYPPTGFVDAINEGSILYTQGTVQRNPVAEIILIQGIFDTDEAATAQDALVDGFLAYVRDNLHQAGGSTLITITSISDIPNYEPDWIVSPRADNPMIYYASRLSLEGLMSSGSLV